MLTLRKLAGVGLGTALAVGLASTSALAAASATYNGATAGAGVTYATQAITGSTIVTAPDSTVFISTPIAGATGLTSNVTFTLPGSLTFAAIPTPSCTAVPVGGGAAATCTGVVLSGVGGAVVGTNTVTVQFSYTTNAACTGCLIEPAIGNFTFTNAGVLSTPTTAALKISASTTDSNLQLAGDKPAAEFASAASALTFSAAGAAPLTIDVVGSGILGKKFLQASVDTLTGDLGALTVTLGAQKGADGATAFSFGGAAGTITLSGNFNNIASAFLAKGGQGNCSSSTSAVATATPASGTITFTGVTVPVAGGGATEVCFVANGTGVIGANALTAPTATIAVSTTNQAATGALSTYNYNGGVVQVQYSGIPGGFANYIRVVNNSGAPATVTAVFQSDSGIATTVPVVTALAANDNALVQVSTLLTSAGVDSTGRASILLLSPSTSVLVSQLTSNPNGTVVNIQ